MGAKEEGSKVFSRICSILHCNGKKLVLILCIVVFFLILLHISILNCSQSEMRDRLEFENRVQIQKNRKLKESKLEDTQNESSKQCGYIFFLSSNDYYTCTAVAIYSLKFWAKTAQPITLMVGEGVSPYLIDYLQATLDINVHYIEYVENPNGLVKKRFQNNYSKLKLYELTQYRKLIYYDSDFLIIRNTDDLCDLPAPFASSTNYVSRDKTADWTKPNFFNAGFFVTDVADDSFEIMYNASRNYESKTGGDQPFMNDYFANRWYHLDKLTDGANGNAYYQHRDLWKDDEVRSIHFTLHINPCVQSKSWKHFSKYVENIENGKSDESDPIYLWMKAKEELLEKFPSFREYFWASTGGYKICEFLP